MILVCCFSYNQSIAQNIPDGSTLPTPGTIPGMIGKPPKYEDINGNPTITDFNYTRKYTPLKPMTSIPAFNNIKNFPVHVTTSYEDGFGKPLMTINRNGSSRDIIEPFDLRTTVDYAVGFLPYPDSALRKFRTNPFENQASYYLNKYPDEDETAYTKSELSITNGVHYTTAYAPGIQNVGLERGVVKATYTNTNISLLKLSFSGGTICKNGYHPYGALFVKETVNEHGQTTVVFSDKTQKILAKKVYDNFTSGSTDGHLYTYYVYNDLGKIKYIVPPKAADQLHNNNCITNFDDLCFSFDYDKFGNVIEKHTPGKDGPDEFIYDVNQQLVMSRNANMASNDEWSFVIFDKQGRTIFSGIYTGAESTSYWRDVIVGNATPVNRGVPQEQTLEYWLQNYFSGTTYPTSLAGCEIHSINYYDSYNNVPAGAPTSFDNSFSADYLTGPTVTDPIPYMFVHSKLVASKVRILDNGIGNNFFNSPWITTVYFYDERSRLIQTHTLNPWNTQDWDISTTQYNFINQSVLDIAKIHAWSQNAKPVTTIRNKYTYGEMTGRLETVTQKVDNGAWQPISGFLYDEMGQVKVKWLGNVEEQVYDFDIRGRSIGINSDSLTTTSIVSNTKTFFSKLHYDHGYSVPRYDGSISGFQWRTRGSDMMSYGYEYDEVGRLTNADFNAYNTAAGPASWNKNTIDFTVSNLAYDLNGNMLQMDQRGYDANMNPDDIDILTYTYDNGNRLMKVEDNGNASAAFIKDFDNGTTGSNNDYQYDLNGNLKADANKNITDISYNHLDLPQSVTAGIGSVKNIYTASGALLQKIITENGITDTMRYWGPFVYKNDDIDHMLHAEGRARYDAVNDEFTYDFFVKDHLGNVRTIVEGSSSYDQVDYHAGWEIISANVEEALFDQIGVVRDNKPLSGPGDLQSGNLLGTDPAKRIGAAILVHTMAGDQFNLHAYGYYEDEQEEYNSYTMPEYMLSSLSDALTGAAGEGGEGGVTPTQTINNLLTSTNYNLYDNLKNSITNNAYPRAYLNYLVFDEQFDLQVQHSKVVQLQGGANAWHQMQMPTNMIMPITGYLLVYLSNESPLNVFVDNEYLIHYESNLLDENNYYPHGLLVQSGTQGTPPENDYLHQGKKLQKELGMELYDFHARQYDPQIGRFWGLDPADQFPSGYTGMGNDPANMVDPSGMWSEDHGVYTAVNGWAPTGSLGHAWMQNRQRNEVAYALAIFDAQNPMEPVAAPQITDGSWAAWEAFASGNQASTQVFMTGDQQLQQMWEQFEIKFENSIALVLTNTKKVGPSGAIQETYDGRMIVYDGDRQELAKKIQEAFDKGNITEDEYIASINEIHSGRSGNFEVDDAIVKDVFKRSLLNTNGAIAHSGGPGVALPLIEGVKGAAGIAIEYSIPSISAGLGVVAGILIPSNIHQRTQYRDYGLDIILPVVDPHSLPWDADTPPGKGFEWQGPKDKGAWYNPETKESLRPDFNHPDPIGPHYDYKNPAGRFRIYPDGSVVPKK